MAYRVMVVEDEKIEREATVLTLQLAQENIEVVCSAENGIGAIALFKEWMPDIVVMDVDLPGISGLETIREMQKFSKHTQYIILSAYNTFGYAQKAVKMGVHEYLLKPCKTQELLEAINSAVQVIEASRTSDYEAVFKEKMETIRPVLESECIFSIASMRNSMSLRKMFDFMGLKAKSGFVFVVKTENGQRRVLSSVKANIETMSVTCIGDILNGLCVFIALSEHEFSQKHIAELMRFVSMMLEYSHMNCYIGAGESSESTEGMHVSYEQALKALTHTEVTGEHYELYSDEISQNNMDSLDLHTIVKRICAQMELRDEEGVVREVKEFFAQMMLRDYTREKTDSLVYAIYIRVLSNMKDNAGEEAYNALRQEDIKRCTDLCSLCDRMIMQLTKNWGSSKTAASAQGTNRTASQAVKYIVEHYQEDINLNRMADYLGITPFYLSKLVKKHTGKTFTDYLTYYRISKAKQMILQGEQSIKEITYAVGYNSQNYFSKIFKKYTGFTPSEYRSSYEEKNEDGK